jgi:2-dehydropantoate 2-reductase
VRSVDPHGDLAQWIPPQRVVGCVVYPASELAQPGVVRHVEGDRLPLGELDGRSSERALAISQAFQRAGFKAPVLEDLRGELWLKLWGNLSFNPISALGQATLADICEFAPSRGLAAAMMQEAAEVAQRLGIAFRVSLERRIAGAAKVGHHKTSMLQDIEAGRPPEVEALLGAVIELGGLTRVPTPHLAAVHALVLLLARSMARAQAGVRLQALLA